MQYGILPSAQESMLRGGLYMEQRQIYKIYKLVLRID